MGLKRPNDGYSAHVEGFLVVAGERFRLAKTNGVTFVLAETCEFPPETEGELLIIIDGIEDSKRIALPSGVALGDRVVPYSDIVPF